MSGVFVGNFEDSKPAYMHTNGVGVMREILFIPSLGFVNTSQLLKEYILLGST